MLLTRPLISDATANKIEQFNLRAFATRKKLGYTFYVQLIRETNTGEEVEQPPQLVLMVMEKREASAVRGEVSAYMGADGELQKEAPFNVETDDAFRLPDGTVGRVNLVLPEEKGVVRAPFTLRV